MGQQMCSNEEVTFEGSLGDSGDPRTCQDYPTQKLRMLGYPPPDSGSPLAAGYSGVRGGCVSWTG